MLLVGNGHFCDALDTATELLMASSNRRGDRLFLVLRKTRKVGAQVRRI